MNVITNTPIVREHAILAAVGEKTHVGVQTAIERASIQGTPQQAKLPTQTQPLSAETLQNALNAQDVNFGKVVAPSGGSAELPVSESKLKDASESGSTTGDFSAVQNFGQLNTDKTSTDTTGHEGGHLKHKVVEEITV